MNDGIKFPEIKTFAQEFEEMVERFSSAANISFDEAADSMIYSIRKIQQKRHQETKR